jgi:transposase-like protein
MFLLRGIVFSHETVRDWEARLAPALADNVKVRAAGVTCIGPSTRMAIWSIRC